MGQGERLENSNSKNLKLSFDKVKFEFCEMKYSWTNKKHSLNSKSAIYIHVIYKFREEEFVFLMVAKMLRFHTNLTDSANDIVNKILIL